jgi:hypothetical protein
MVWGKQDGYCGMGGNLVGRGARSRVQGGSPVRWLLFTLLHKCLLYGDAYGMF